MAHATPRNWSVELRQRLPAYVFEPVPIRLLWLPTHWFLIACELFALTLHPSLPWRMLLSLLLGLSFAGLAFVAHEALHGALTRNTKLRHWVGGLGFLPFCLSPQLWMAWHNRVHHAHTNEAGRDPDCLATLAEFRQSRGVRLSTWLQTHSFGIFTLLVGFTVQSATVLIRARKLGYLSRRFAKRAWAETILAVTFWSLLFAYVGPGLFVWAYLIPLMIGNSIVMAHIVTNHGQMPLDTGEGPLATSLSVTVPRPVSFYTLDFGYHVEHHILPTVSHRYGRLIRDILVQEVPSEYHSLPLSAALAKYFRQLRIYADPHTLLDPETGRTSPTLEATEPTTEPHSAQPSGIRPPEPRKAPASRPPISTIPSPAH
jgi:fatty acid desaturase